MYVLDWAKSGTNRQIKNVQTSLQLSNSMSLIFPVENKHLENSKLDTLNMKRSSVWNQILWFWRRLQTFNLFYPKKKIMELMYIKRICSKKSLNMITSKVLWSENAR